ncbi:hypothetical protein [Hymenobacter daeguensis]
MTIPPIAVWFENGQYYCPTDLSDLAQQIHKMSVSRDDLMDRAYRLKNRLTFIYRKGDVGIDPIFELDSMRPANYSSTTYAFLRMSDDNEWEVRDADNNVVSLKAVDGARDLVNFYKNESAFRKLLPNSGL